MTFIEKDTAVHAVEPTCLGSQTHYTLRPSDLYLCFSVETAIVVPGPIDTHRLKNALAHTLSAYPLYAGRIEKENINGEITWRVRLDNAGALFDVIDSDDTRVVPVDAIIQSPFQLAQKIHYTRHYSGSSEEPLLRITVTRFKRTGQTAIGFSSAHAVGDGWVLHAFMRSISQKYQSLENHLISLSYDLPPPLDVSPESVQAVRTPWLNHPYPIGTTPDHLDPTKSTPSMRVDFRFTAEQLVELRNIVTALAPQSEVPATRLSIQDTLVALVAACITRADTDSPPIRTISYTINHRGVAPVPPNAVGNALIQPIGQLDANEDADDIYALALAIRRSLQHYRDPYHAASRIIASGAKFKAAADSSHGLDFSPGPGMLFVNSTRPFNWTSAHFGYENRACFYHTVLNAPRYMKIFTPNPTLLPDGTWKDNTGAAEIVFYLQPHVVLRFVDVLRSRARELGVKGEIEFVALTVESDTPDGQQSV